MSLSCSADVIEHGFCHRVTMVCHERLRCNCCGCCERKPFHISIETSHGRQTPKQMPMIPIECRLAGQATGSDYLLAGAPSLHSTP